MKMHYMTLLNLIQLIVKTRTQRKLLKRENRGQNENSAEYGNR